MLKKLMKKEEGFTLAELLIVVAIIAVLVAISIPIFTSQLEKSREATDISNVRSAYAEAMAAYMADGASGNHSAQASAKQQADGWVGESGQVVTRIDGVETVISYAGHKAPYSYTVSVSNDASGSAVVSVG